MSATTAPLVQGNAVRSGWGVVETSRGVPFRWMVEPTAEILVVVPAAWQTVRLFCSFVSWMPYDVLVTASPADERAEDGVEPATGVARAGRVGRHRQLVTLSRPMPAGAARIGFEALRPWQEPGTDRRLSLALTELRVLHLPNGDRHRHPRWTVAQG